MPLRARPRVGISRCLLGDDVRYDGGNKRAPWLAELGEHVEWLPICPEVEIGMGVPREPIRLVAASGGVTSGAARVRLAGAESGVDWTDRMIGFARARVAALQSLHVSGFVLKTRSPSCGPGGVLVHQADGGAAEEIGRGLFAQALIEAVPDLPIADDETLQAPDAREAFLRRVTARAFHRLD